MVANQASMKKYDLQNYLQMRKISSERKTCTYHLWCINPKIICDAMSIISYDGAEHAQIKLIPISSTLLYLMNRYSAVPRDRGAC